jgi:hypothetical protein
VVETRLPPILVGFELVLGLVAINITPTSGKSHDRMIPRSPLSSPGPRSNKSAKTAATPDSRLIIKCGTSWMGKRQGLTEAGTW